MADSAYVPGLTIPHTEVRDELRHAPRHSGLVRVTHWINALSFAGLVVSGIGILLAHPRFYWGETGGVGAPALFSLPLPFLLGGPSGWGRYLHFEAAWLCVLNGFLYVASGVAGGHFRRLGLSYERLQRTAYLGVVLVGFPLMIWTGLAMSPAVTSVFPWLVTSLGGHQCARTIHFFGAVLLVLFLAVHVAMVWRAGFRRHVSAMITGRLP